MHTPSEFTTDEEVLDFLQDYCTFGPNRVYLLLAIARPRENSELTHNRRITFREIVTDEEHLRRKYATLKTLTDNYIPEEDIEDLTFRLYISSNARDTEKAFYLYQKTLVELTHKLATGHEATRKRIKRLDKEWESTLQSDGNKDDNYFIIDIDTEDASSYETIREALQEETTIRTEIKSPNGFHIITEPFNYPDFDLRDTYDIEIKTDSLLFLRLFN